jgi:hypothetical protein
MSLTTIQTPIVTAASIQCAAISSSQIRYEYTRKDGTFTTVGKTGGNKLILDDWSIEHLASEGDRIYVRFDDDGVNAEGNITAILTSPTQIETDIDYSDVTTLRSGFANDFNIRANYRVKVTLAEYPDYESFYTSGFEGLVVINLGDSIRELMLINNITYTDLTMSRLEIWDGSSESPTAETGLLITLSLRQILDEYGANLWNHIMKTGTYEGIVLTKFPDNENRLWSGWKRTASVLIDPGASGRFSGSTVSIVTNNANENRIYTSSINVHPITLTAAKIFEYDFGGGADFGTDYYTQLYAIAIPPSDSTTQKIYYENRTECPSPIMIEWINSFGAWEQWLFELNQVFDTDAEPGVIYEPGINDYIENIKGIKKRITGRFTQRVQLSAGNLTLGQLRALTEIKYSPEVRMFLEKDGSEYIEVIVYANYSEQYGTKGQIFEFSLSLEF